ncbi:DEAD/DEAH box helicase [Legionella saoudiensis]|uniref:DEAD/DEAH box helicase n=1 Tax=Legionella saoudiensis TaxID=1750561 RepID=UPI0007312A25|nr:AAA domain-containing protein [Legionella saoudiensis]
MENGLSTERKTCLDVLRFWHQIEFFTPFDLDNAVSQKGEVRDIAFQSLFTENANALLPWLGGEKELLFHYQVFLLPFDKKELTRLSTRFFPIEFQKQHNIELEETLDDEGLTCFARLFVDKTGTPRWQSLSVSTLPWAMGMVQSNDFEKLSEVNFAKDMELLKSAINLLEEKTELNQLDAHTLLNLLKILTQWARFSPDYPFVIKIKFIPVKEPQEISAAIKALPSQSLSVEDIPGEEDEHIDENEPLNILNSFFIRDLEKSINYLAYNTHNILEAYVNGCADKKDVLAPLNHSMVLKQLAPQQNNLGRWPAPPKHGMSLMQQLFINQCIIPNIPQSIYATNGPPGTGKTTLLKDIIAENIVNRAKKLATFDSVYSCFSGWKKIVLGDHETSVGLLQPELTGFEMLVASSNNAAVENITLELPLKKNLADEYKTTCNYLKPEAAKLATKVFKQRIQPINEKQKPWGLIAVALGNAANRQTFIERFFSSPESKAQASERVRQGEYLNIWEWRDQYKGISFQQAKKNFQQALIAVELYRSNLQSFANLHEKITHEEYPNLLIKQREAVVLLQKDLYSMHEEHAQASSALTEIEHHQHLLYREIDQQLIFKPGIWKKLFKRNLVKQFNTVIESLQSRRLELSQKLLTHQEQVANLSKAINAKKDELKKAQEHLKYLEKQAQDEQEAYKQFQVIFPEANLPGNSITTQDHQLGYWHSSHYNTLRSELFVQALQLHQAWIAEALQKKYFGGNLYALKAVLNGKHPVASSDELFIWQSLFMVIPVVSSSFASIGRQFKNLEAESLGWLLIDEAGQAIPQAAVGAMLRCKKAIVVGDPRQIEPIMTLPPHLIEGVAKYHFKSPNPYWLPNITSIQRLADLASAYGSVVQQSHQQEWIGLPLLVHRRCLDPMFSVANDIAYENKMINAREPLESSIPQLPPSAWFDVAGKAIDKQYVPEHGDCFLRLFIAFYNHERGLPRLFVITPFKRIKKYLQELVQKQDNWVSQIDPNIPPPTRFALSKWLHAHIGTVHTFQGKENEKVIFVLGADKTQQGAINWASSKPNLLNVALTRATDRIYIIGEWDIWANRKYFITASTVLSRIKKP